MNQDSVKNSAKHIKIFESRQEWNGRF